MAPHAFDIAPIVAQIHAHETRIFNRICLMSQHGACARAANPLGRDESAQMRTAGYGMRAINRAGTSMRSL
jgi:hypothetical protein